MPDTAPGGLNAILGAAVAAGDLLVLTDVSASEDKKITVAEMLIAIGAAELLHAPSHEVGGDDPITSLSFQLGGFDHAAVLLAETTLFVGLADPIVGDLGVLRFGATAGVSELSFYNPDGSPRVRLDSAGEGLRISDGLGVLQHQIGDYAAGFFAATPSAVGLAVGDGTGETRALVAGDGTGVTFYDAAGNPLTFLNESALTFHNTSAEQRAVYGPGIAGINDPADVAHGVVLGDVLFDQSDFGLVINGLTGTPKVTISELTAGFFGATPYGQDAYIDPTTITPEQLGLAQIARGWMAAA